MTISVGDRLPEATFLKLGENGPEPVKLHEHIAGKKVVLFGLPGAFTRTCSAAHVPSFMRTADQFRAKGVAHIICFAHNDPFVMQAWAEDTGGDKAGIEFLSDSDASFTKALGLAFTAPPGGFYDRTVRHAMYVEDGVVKVLHLEEERGVCDLTGGEKMLEAI